MEMLEIQNRYTYANRINPGFWPNPWTGLPRNTTRTIHCRKGWSYYDGSCYVFVTREKDTWIEAVSYCQAVHGSLIDILDWRENNFIKSELLQRHASGKNCFVYMSAADIEVEGQWIWSNTCVRVVYTDWAPTEP
ncbi:perlucin-like protein [Mizuhopecten yessoensis]|uniref:perlucin-like protein n=1 Tax=Mizuhopecten yessoensis TaxID=6573 RepID=UPI000B45A507|nr:perlucin-like protein [Mizuhopecten yessoensis]